MSRKLKLNPEQRDLMCMLEEAGAEDLRCIVATIQPDEIRDLEHNVYCLHRLGLIQFYRDLGQPGSHYIALAQSDIDNLPNFQELLNQHDTTCFAGIMLTELGHASLTA